MLEAENERLRRLVNDLRAGIWYDPSKLTQRGVLRATAPEPAASSEWHDEREPFPAFLHTLNGLELAVMQHDARQLGDDVTLKAVLAELKRRASSALAGASSTKEQ